MPLSTGATISPASSIRHSDLTALLQRARRSAARALQVAARPIAQPVLADKIDFGETASGAAAKNCARVAGAERLSGRIWRAFARAGRDDAREFVVKRETDRVENRRLAGPGFSGDGEEARRAQRLAVEVDGEAFGETGEIGASDRQNAQCHASCRRRSKQSK